MQKIYKIFDKTYNSYYEPKESIMVGDTKIEKLSKTNGKIYTTLKNAKIAIPFNKLKNVTIHEFELDNPIVVEFY